MPSRSLNVPYFRVVLGSLTAENSLTSTAQHSPATVLPCSAGARGLVLPFPHSSFWLREEEGLGSPLQHSQFP